MRYGIIENGVCVNVVDAPEGFVFPPSVVFAASAGVGIGDVWDGQKFVPQPSPPPTPSDPNEVVYAQLAGIDRRTVRPLRAVLTAQANGQSPSAEDTAMLAQLDAKAAALRAQLV